MLVMQSVPSLDAERVRELRFGQRNTIGRGDEPVSMPAGDKAPAKSAFSPLRSGGGEISRFWQECRTNKKAPRPNPEGLPVPLSERRVSGLGSSFRAGRRWDFRFR